MKKSYANVAFFVKQRVTVMNLETRITHNPLQCGGKPCIRGMRIRVSDILQMLGEGVGSEEILCDFPDLEQQDIQACLLYAARRANLERLVAWSTGLMHKIATTGKLVKRNI